MLAVSFISTIKVDSPDDRLSDAPTLSEDLVYQPNNLPTLAGTKHPICAISTMRPVWRQQGRFTRHVGPGNDDDLLRLSESR
jgi:hypothetical protein